MVEKKDEYDPDTDLLKVPGRIIKGILGRESKSGQRPFGNNQIIETRINRCLNGLFQDGFKKEQIIETMKEIIKKVE